ncbi:MAG: phage head closure protein [Pseudomonadota bacterium]
MSRPRIGTLRYRLTLEAPERVATEGGAADLTWTPIASVFARIMPRGGREQFASHALAADVTHDITFRYRSGVRPQMRLTDGARVFEILAVIDVAERRRWITCQCREDLR